MLLFVWKAFMIDVSRIDVMSHTVSDVLVPYSWSSVPYTIGLWRKFLCDVIKYGCFERAFLVEDFVVSKMLNLFLNHLVWVKFPLHFVTICVTCIVDFYVLSRASEVGSPTNHRLWTCFTKAGWAWHVTICSTFCLSIQMESSVEQVVILHARWHHKTPYKKSQQTLETFSVTRWKSSQLILLRFTDYSLKAVASKFTTLMQKVEPPFPGSKIK